MQGWVLRSARPINPVILVLFTPNCIHIVIPKGKKQINVSNKLIIAMQFKSFYFATCNSENTFAAQR